MWKQLGAGVFAVLCVVLICMMWHHNNSAHDFSRRKVGIPHTSPHSVSAIWTFTTAVDNACVKRFRALHPTTPVHAYTVSRAATFIDEHCPVLSKPYRDLRPIAFKADLWRYCALYTYGGAYLDDDLWLTRPLTLFDDVPGNLLLIENGIHTQWFPYRVNRDGIWNAYMIARKPGDAVLKCAMDTAVRLIAARTRTTLLGLTGPDMLGMCVLPTSDINVVGYLGSRTSAKTWSNERLNFHIKVPRDADVPHYRESSAFSDPVV